jgi:hypothetical protein
MGVQHVAHGLSINDNSTPPFLVGFYKNTITAIRSINLAGRPIKLPKITLSRRYGFEGGLIIEEEEEEEEEEEAPKIALCTFH